jgi:hypothetical protein
LNFPLLVELVHLVHEYWVSHLVEVLPILHHLEVLQLLWRYVVGIHLCVLERLLLIGVEDDGLSMLKLQLLLKQVLHLLLCELSIVLWTRLLTAAVGITALVSMEAI